MTLFFTSGDGQTATLEKPALIFVSGQHKDSKSNFHVFSRERVAQLVRNTNKFLKAGGRLPFQRDHDRSQSNNIGDVESLLYTKEITQADLPNQRQVGLIGQLGVFVDKIVIKGQKAVDEVLNKTLKTLSAGIDPATECFVEISATPIPAIIGPSLFSRDEGIIYFESYGGKVDSYTNGRKAFSFDDLRMLNQDAESMKEDFDALADGLFRILNDIRHSSDDELKGQNPIKLSLDSVEVFIDEISMMFDLTESGKKQRQPVPGVRSEFSRRPKTLGFRLI